MGRSKKFYAVRRGRRPGIYTAWFGDDGAEAQVRAFPGAIFKGFATRAEAAAFMRGAPPAVRPRPRGGDRRQETATADPPAGDADTVIYTDGGCRGNPGPGGYGVVIEQGGRRRELSAGFRCTTNNRMELLAVIVALEALPGPRRIVLYTDSRYVADGISKGWARRWQSRGWFRAPGAPAENADLWERLLEACSRHRVRISWVRGHAGNPGNERCDRLAVAAAGGSDLGVDRNYETGRTQLAQGAPPKA